MKQKIRFIVIALLAIMALAAMPVFVRERISISAGEDVWVHSGADVLISSGALSGGNFDTSSQTIGMYGDSGLVKLAAPTAIGTATPVLLVDSAGVSNILEIRDASTPVFTINNGGAVVQVGASTHSGGQTINNWLKVAAPTAIATATPAAVIDSLGVSTILEVRDAATPQVIVANGGAAEFKKAVDIDGGVTLNSTVDIDDNITSGTGGITMTDNVMIDGQADANQLIIQAHSTQTNDILVVEQSDGTDVLTVDNDGNATFTDEAIMSTWARMTAQTTLTVTQDGTITPTGTYQGLVNYTGAVQTGSMSTGTAGQLLILTNIGSNAITISDTGTIMLSGNIALGQYDTLTLFSDGTNWLQLATSNN